MAQSNSKGLSIREAEGVSLHLRPKRLSENKGGGAGVVLKSQGQQLTSETGVQWVRPMPLALRGQNHLPI